MCIRDRFCAEAFAASEGRPVLIDKFLEDAVEVDVDCIADGDIEVIGAVMEHIEKAGIHSGDSACAIPPQGLDPAVVERIREHTRDVYKRQALDNAAGTAVLLAAMGRLKDYAGPYDLEFIPFNGEDSPMVKGQLADVYKRQTS